MLFVVGNGLREVPFDSGKMSDQQWNKISELSALPPEARTQLEEYIGFYRDLRRDAQHDYLGLWEILSDARNTEQKSLGRLTELLQTPQFFLGLAIGLSDQAPIFDPELALVREWLTQLYEEKKKLVDWYDKAEARLRQIGQRGPRKSSLHNLVHLLNYLLERYGRQRITQSQRSNELVWQVCQIADPDLKGDKGRSRIRNVIKEIADEYGPREYDFEVEGWGELIPHWKRTKKLDLEDPRLSIKLTYREEGNSVHCSIDAHDALREAFPLIFLSPLFGPDK
jgi:hypothetical protein